MLVKCDYCGGKGSWVCPHCLGTGCHVCEFEGNIVCPVCKGSKTILTFDD